MLAWHVIQMQTEGLEFSPLTHHDGLHTGIPPTTDAELGHRDWSQGSALRSVVQSQLLLRPERGGQFLILAV